MPQLRIHFTDRDIAHTRLKLETDLMWEIISSAQILQHRDGDLSFGLWRRHVRELAAHDAELRMALHTMAMVAPHAILSTSPECLRAESGARQLNQVLRVYYRAVIEPHLPMIEDRLCTDAAARVQRYLHFGPQGLLDMLGPATRWDPPVLSVDYSHQGDLHLDGRGLVLVPCYFALHHQVALADPQACPVLAHPIRTESRLLAGVRAGGDHVTALLGATRASILQPATVSHHTGVLREAGLIVTEREENFARHLITPLGLRVLACDR